jgi:hypothetical protein
MLSIYSQQMLLCQSSAAIDAVNDYFIPVDSPVAPRILVDADNCPLLCLDILMKTAMRSEIHLLLVANHFLRAPSSHYVHKFISPRHPQASDVMIHKNVLPRDIVIADDYELIRRVVCKGAYAIDPRGKTFTSENSGFASEWRIPNMSDLYHNGLILRHNAYRKKDKVAFANALDRLLTKVVRKAALVS